MCANLHSSQAAAATIKFFFLISLFFFSSLIFTMVLTDPSENHLVYDVKLSSVVPASISGEDKVHELKNMDLVMKLHYLRGVYFFNKDAVEGFNISDFKEPMFLCLKQYYPLAGRMRRADDEGRPFIKCNDSGVRILEAKCTKSLKEWLLLSSDDSSLNDDQLAYNQVLGPELGFSPLVFVQFTWFKCGGISIGLSWAHILGDAFSASDFIYKWGHFLAGDQLASKNLDLAMAGTKIYKSISSVAKIPFSIKMVDPVGDLWLTTTDCKMQSCSVHLTAKQLNHLLSKISGVLGQEAKVKPFELVSAIIWKSLAKIRGTESEPKIVTICRNDSSCDRTNEISSNSQVISTVEADLRVSEADLLELANLIAQKQVDERSMIEELMEKNEMKGDLIVYGANLTFVDLEDAKIYALELKGHNPVFAKYSVSGVGDQGAVFVLSATRSGEKEEGGRVVNFILPENQLADLKDELRKYWGIF